MLGLGLSWFGIRLFDAAVADVGKPYWIRFTMDYTVFGFMALVCLVTGVLFGIAPALQVSKTNVNEVLKEGGRGSSGSARARRLTSAMVVVELTLTLVLLTGAGLMVRSFMNLYSLELGVDTAHVLTMRTLLSEQRYPTPGKAAAVLRLAAARRSRRSPASPPPPRRPRCRCRAASRACSRSKAGRRPTRRRARSVR